MGNVAVMDTPFGGDIREYHEKVVLFLGRITFQKGPDYFVRAARRVVDAVKNVRFVMAGTGDLYRREIELAAEMGMGKYFHYTGFLDTPSVERLFRMSDLYVMPSVSEPFGITPLEAMKQGVPVIVSRQSGVRETVHSCISVDFWDVNGLADKMIAVLNNDDLAETMVTEAIHEVEQMHWDNTARTLEDIYAEVLPGL